MPRRTPPALLGALAALLLASCIDPIDLDVGEPERRLVVEATLLEGPGPHEVRLHRTAAFTQGIDARRPPEEGARVTVTLDGGREVLFPEAGPGRYLSAPGALVGEPGRAYALRLELADGTVYTAPAETMRPSRGIAATEVALERRAGVVNGVLTEVPQLTLFVTPEDDLTERAHYRWTYTGTAVVETCLTPNSPFCTLCYVPVTGRSAVQLADNSAFTGGALPPQRAAEFVLTGATARHFVFPFQIDLVQQTLTPEAFAFWTLIRDTRDRVGSLFDPPPDAAIGNVARTDDPADYALGHFTVAGASHLRTCLRLPSPRPPLSVTPMIGTCGGTIAGSTAPPPAYREACQGG